MSGNGMGGGGMVKPPVVPMRGYGSDTVPAALTPGEAVFNPRQLSGIMPRTGGAHKLRQDQLLSIALAMRGRR